MSGRSKKGEASISKMSMMIGEILCRHKNLFQALFGNEEAFEQTVALFMNNRYGFSSPADIWEMFFTIMISACRFSTLPMKRILGLEYAPRTIHPDIVSKNFPYQENDLEPPKKVETVSLTQRMAAHDTLSLTKHEALQYLEELHYRPATLMEMLWWWIKSPPQEGAGIIIALGSIWNNQAPYIFYECDDVGIERICKLDLIDISKNKNVATRVDPIIDTQEPVSCAAVMIEKYLYMT